MKIRNKNLEIIDSEVLVSEIIAELESNNFQSPTEAQAKDALATMYYEASLLGNKSVFSNNDYAMPKAQIALSKQITKENLWEIVKKHFCAVVNEASTKEVLVGVIIAAIALIMPIGIILKPLIVIIVGYLLNKGVSLICGV